MLFLLVLPEQLLHKPELRRCLTRGDGHERRSDTERHDEQQCAPAHDHTPAVGRVSPNVDGESDASPADGVASSRGGAAAAAAA